MEATTGMHNVSHKQNLLKDLKVAAFRNKPTY